MNEEATMTTETTTPAVETAVITPTPPQAKEPPPSPAEPRIDIVQMTRAEYDSWRAEREQLAREKAAAEEARLAAEEKAARNEMEKGQFDKAQAKLDALAREKEARLLRERDEAIAAERARAAAEQKRIETEKANIENALRSKEARAKRYALDGELGRALAGHNLVDGAADDLTALLRGQFQVDEHGESFAVRAADGRGVAEFVDQYLKARPHYIKAGTTRSGTIGGSTTPAATGVVPAADPALQPRNMGEALILHMQSFQKAQGDARANMGLPMGLRPANR